MHIELKRGSSTKLYVQIALTLADRIRSGLIEPGTRLPSVRKMTADLGVSLVTVSKAYAELEAIQLVTCSQGRVVMYGGARAGDNGGYGDGEDSPYPCKE